MDVQQVGRSALIVAWWRALETERPEPMFFDPFARLFLDAQAREEAQALTSAAPATAALVAVRTRYFDEVLCSAMAAGTDQVVLLGAGLDCRAFRLGHTGARFFEIDRPDVLAWKNARLEAAGYPPAAAALPMDYLAEDWLSALLGAGLSPARPAILLWEGNSMYIPYPQITALLAAIRGRLPNATVVLDVLSERLVAAADQTPAARGFEDAAARWVTGIDDLEALAAKTGFVIGETHLLAALSRRWRPWAPLDARLLGDYTVCVLNPAGGA